MPRIPLVLLLLLTLALPAPVAAAGPDKPCKPLRCRDLGVECGVWDDGCGGTIDCGECEEGHECVAGQCMPTGSEWPLPACTRITGTAAVSFTDDEGGTLTSTTPLRELTYTYGLAALDTPGEMLAAVMTNLGTTLLRSIDSGCSWSELTVLDDFSALRIVPAPGGRAYIWSRGRSRFWSYANGVTVEHAAPGNIYGLAVHPADADHLRVGGEDCQLHESFDGGQGFLPLGNPAQSGQFLFYDIAFAPGSWDHALCGGSGGWRTEDAGGSWSRIETFDPETTDLVHLFAYAPSDPSHVWARVNVDLYGRELLFSDDGGVSFESAIVEGMAAADQHGILRTVTLVNQPTMAAHPDDENLLYFVFGSYYQNYGTDLWRYDADSGQLSVRHIEELDDIDAMVFHPGDPSLLYVGLEEIVTSAAKSPPGTGEAMARPTLIAATAMPNPFNPCTTLELEIGQAGHVRLDIYNLRGERLCTLVDRRLEAGRHAFPWDGRDRLGQPAASGVYLYRAQAADGILQGKIALLK